MLNPKKSVNYSNFYSTFATVVFSDLLVVRRIRKITLFEAFLSITLSCEPLQLPLVYWTWFFKWSLLVILVTVLRHSQLDNVHSILCWAVMKACQTSNVCGSHAKEIRIAVRSNEPLLLWDSIASVPQKQLYAWVVPFLAVIKFWRCSAVGTSVATVERREEWKVGVFCWEDTQEIWLR